MPELPEVETIRRGLIKVIVGKKITKFESLDSKVIQFAEKDIIGSEIKEIERRAKILIFHLSRNVISNEVRNPMNQGISRLDKSMGRDDKVILTHLKMTGQLIWEENPGTNDFQLKKSRVAGGHPSPDWVAKLPNAYTRAVFHFGDDSVLFFNDLRRFGYMKLYDTKDLDSLTELIKLGPEPFSDAFNADYLMRRATKIPNRKIKQFITDQEIISGVGNIYVDEALFYAGILPTRAVKDIQLSEWKKIRDSIIKSLELGLKYGGSSEDTYVDAFGNQGEMNQHTKVYRKTGQPCSACGTKIERITLGGRGTHFCPSCQK
jgi:formamidopyrimidine-DNA glycosylase